MRYIIWLQIILLTPDYLRLTARQIKYAKLPERDGAPH